MRALLKSVGPPNVDGVQVHGMRRHFLVVACSQGAALDHHVRIGDRLAAGIAQVEAAAGKLVAGGEFAQDVNGGVATVLDLQAHPDLGAYGFHFELVAHRASCSCAPTTPAALTRAPRVNRAGGRIRLTCMPPP